MNTPTLPSVILTCVLLTNCMAAAASVPGSQIRALSGNESLPGTPLLTMPEDLSEAMQDGAHRFIERVIEDSLKTRATRWHRNTASPMAYSQSVTGQRSQLKQILGVVDPRPPVVMERFGDDFNPSLVAESNSVQAYQVRWLTLENVWAEGLLLVPHKTEPKAFVVALPDASQQPERIAGLDGSSSHAWGRHLAESGIVVLIPTLIDRRSDFSGNPFVVANHPATAMQSDQTHREWIYRQAFHMGRHVIGYEVQKILAGIDWIEERYGTKVTIGVAGYGEGGLLALQAAACDERIDACLVSGYFDSRQRVWNEPIYRNVFRLLSEFGDAEIASLIAPRPLVIEHSVAPEITGHKGSITTPEFSRVEVELRRAKSFIEPLAWPVELVSESGKPCAEPCRAALAPFAKALGAPLTDYESIEPWSDQREKLDVSARQKRTVKEVEAHVQMLVRQSELVRDNRFLGKLMPERLTNSRGGAWFKTETVPTELAEVFAKAAEPFREELWSQIFGRITEAKQPPNVRTRAIYEHPKWIAYDVVLDVYRESFA